MSKLILSETAENLIDKNLIIEKNDSFSKFDIIDFPPILKSEKIDNVEIRKKIKNKEVLNFYNTVIENIDHSNFSNMYENLKSLRIFPIRIKKYQFLNRNIVAYYDCVNNIVRYTKKIKDRVLFHELFHMASTVKRESDKSIFSGFSQSTNLGENRLIGRGLNEGYTQLLAERYFELKNKTYPIEVLIASKIEDIIGKERMETMYLNADLKSLTGEFLKYNNEKSIIMFLYDIDILGSLYSQKNMEQDFSWLKKTYYYVVEFLLNMKIKKAISEIYSLKELKIMLIEYSKDFQYKITNRKDNKQIVLIDEIAIEEIIEKKIIKLKNDYVINGLKTYSK